jgi:hypothetical protein
VRPKGMGEMGQWGKGLVAGEYGGIVITGGT